MSHNTILTLKVLDYTDNLLIKKLFLRVANIAINVLNDSPTVQINDFPENIDDFYVEKIELLTNNDFKDIFV